MGALLDEMKAQKPNNSIGARLKRDLSKEDYNDLMIAMKTPDISNAVIAKALNNRGFKVGVSSIGLMRRNLK
jgi:hypothetical protein